jgi:hypothetical protein
MWYRIIDGVIAESSGQTPKLPGVSNAAPAQLNASGWYQYADLTPEIQSQIDADKAAEAAAAAAAEIERKATPIPYDQPIEVPALVLLTQTDMLKGVGLIIYEDAGAYHLTTYLQHASPNPDAAEVKARKEAAIAADKLARKAAKDELDALKEKVAKAEADIVELKKPK